MGNKITSGIWFVFIGLILLLQNLNVIEFNFIAIIKYWPLLIVILGVNLIVQNRQYGSYLKIVCNVLFLGWIFFVGMTAPKSDWTSHLFNNNKIAFDGLDEDGSYVTQARIPMDSINIDQASLELNGGASNFSLNGVNGIDLIQASSPTQDMVINLENKVSGDKSKLELNLKPTKGNSKTGSVEAKINKNVQWDMEFNIGASKVTADLSDITFKHFELNGGASNIDLILGEPNLTTSNLDISSGASKITLRIPKQAAVKLKYESILSSSKIEGFQPLVDGETETANYHSASKKFVISIEGAANSIDISRY
ncbi:MAG: LiaI-LiaF-like domain-containing protein [Sphingobacterium sp.]